jgi:hypothetical protein
VHHVGFTILMNSRRVQQSFLRYAVISPHCADIPYSLPIINRETKEFLHICMHTSLLFSIFMFHINLCVPIANSAINKTFYSINFRHCVAVWCAKPVSTTWRNSPPSRHVFNQTYHQSMSHYLYDFFIALKLSYALFWIIPRHLYFKFRRFGTFYSIFIGE